MRFRFALAFVILFTGGIVGAPQPQAACDIAGWQQDAGQKYVDMFDVFWLATLTPREQLAPIMLELRRARRAFERADHPDCLREAVNLTVEGMADFIGALEHYLETGRRIGERTDVDKFSEGYDALIELGAIEPFTP